MIPQEELAEAAMTGRGSILRRSKPPQVQILLLSDHTMRPRRGPEL